MINTEAFDQLMRGLGIVGVTFLASVLFVPTIMLSDSGTTEAIQTTLLALVLIVLIWGFLVFSAAKPNVFESRIPGPPLLRKIVVRGPVYFVAVLGVVLGCWLVFTSLWYRFF